MLGLLAVFCFVRFLSDLFSIRVLLSGFCPISLRFSPFGQVPPPIARGMPESVHPPRPFSQGQDGADTKRSEPHRTAPYQTGPHQTAPLCHTIEPRPLEPMQEEPHRHTTIPTRTDRTAPHRTRQPGRPSQIKTKRYFVPIPSVPI